jgi:hypothetical protein
LRIVNEYAFTKRQKERQRQEKQQEKRARRMESRERKASGGSENEDPDIAGIALGPQPPAEER